MYYNTIMAGFGGQGIMLIGNLLAYSAMNENKNVTYMPSYGVEMRGGTANCTVVISDGPVGSPIIGHPKSAIVMNKPSLLRFGPNIVEGGLLLINSSLISELVDDRLDLKQIKVPANEKAGELGNDKMANMVIFGAFLQLTKVVKPDTVFEAFKKVLDERYHKLIPKNVEMIKAGMKFAEDQDGG